MKKLLECKPYDIDLSTNIYGLPFSIIFIYSTLLITSKKQTKKGRYDCAAIFSDISFF